MILDFFSLFFNQISTEAHIASNVAYMDRPKSTFRGPAKPQHRVATSQPRNAWNESHGG